MKACVKAAVARAADGIVKGVHSRTIVAMAAVVATSPGIVVHIVTAATTIVTRTLRAAAAGLRPSESGAMVLIRWWA